MPEEKSVPFLVKIHNATCPFWILNIAFLKKMDPGCQIASKYEEEE